MVNSTFERFFYDDCEDMYTSKEWSDNWTSDLNYFEVTGKEKRAGNNSYHFVVTKQDQVENNNKRSELKLVEDFEYDEYWFGWSFKMDDGFNGKVPSWMVSFQFHGHPDDGERCPDGERSGEPGEPWRNPPLAFYILHDDDNDEYYFEFTVRGDSKPCTYNYNYSFYESYGHIPITFGEWMDFVFHVNFKYDNTGFAEVWMNDTQYVNVSEIPTTYNDASGPYLKIGLYGDMLKLDDGTVLNVYYDEIRIANKTGSYGMVRTPLPEEDSKDENDDDDDSDIGESSRWYYSLICYILIIVLTTIF